LVGSSSLLVGTLLTYHPTTLPPYYPTTLLNLLHLQVCVYAAPIDQDYVRKVMNSAVRSSGDKRDEVGLQGHWSY
jgi:hypothetical protein